MDERVARDNTSVAKANVRVQMKETDNTEKPNKCHQCDYSSSHAGDLRKHLKIHSGEKSNKCNQCDFAASREDNFRRHLKAHSRINLVGQCKSLDVNCVS